jgi:cytochrome oxidase Cu insertion factor (SCO1/SenC/PrrC family)
MRARAYALSAAGGLFIASLVALTSVHFVGCNAAQAALAAARPDAIWSPGARSAPEFTLRDVWGSPTSLSQQRGRIVLLTFLDSACKQTCPIEGAELSQTLRRFDRSTPLTLFVVSVQAGADTVASVRSVVARWGGWQADWHWLVGSGDGGLERVWAEYGISVELRQETLQHGSDLFLIDGQGYERAGFTAPFLVPPVAESIRSLVREVSGPTGVVRTLAACSG